MIDPDARFTVDELFHFQDARTVLTGVFDRDPEGLVRPGRFGVWVDGECVGVVLIEGEMIVSGRSAETRRRRLRSLSTTGPFRLTRSDLRGKQLVLRPIAAPSRGGSTMHRHLLGIESPPPDYVPDPVTLGPVLPDGWDGDAWSSPDGRGHFLRAWNKASGLIAIARAPTYDEARRRLIDEISTGARRASVPDREPQTA